MKFTDLEKATILSGLSRLICVDNNIAKAEENLFMQIYNKFGANENHIRMGAELSANPAKTIEIVQSFTQDKKELFSALLYMIMNADGINNLLEQGFIEGTQIFYNLPEVTPERARKLYNDFMNN